MAASPVPDLHRWARPGVLVVATNLDDMQQLSASALRQARETGARLLLFHVVTTEIAHKVEAAGRGCYDASDAIYRARTLLQPWCLRARSAGIACDIVVRKGNPSEQILDAARQFHADRVLLGTRGWRRINKMLPGSVAEQVLRLSDLPVMTVGPEVHHEAGKDARNRAVLLSTTLRETSRTGAALACEIARAQHRPLVVLHVLPESLSASGSNETFSANALRQLHLLAADLRRESSATAPQIEVKLAHGNPCEQILQAAGDIDACLLVLGSSHPLPPQSLTRDHTLRSVLSHAHCPALTLLETNQQAAQEQVRELVAV